MPMRAVVTLLLAMCAIAARGEDSVTLRWSFKVGDEFHVTISEQTTLLSTYYPLASRQETDIDLQMVWRVTAVDGDVAQVEQTIQRIRLSLTTPTEDGSGKIEIDTAREQTLRDTAGALRRQLLAMVGVTVQVHLSPDGAIQQVVLPEASREQLRRAPSATVLREMFSPQGIDSLFRQANFVLPPEPVKLNDTWTIERTPLAQSDKKIHKRYTLKKVESAEDRVLAHLDVTSELVDQPSEPDSTRPADSAAGNEGAAATITAFQGTGRGEFDVSRGHFVSGEWKTELTTVAKLRDNTIETKLDKTSRINIRRVE